MHGAARHDDVAADVTRELGQRIEAAQRAGIAREQIIIDPGIGFAKTAEQSIELLRRLKSLGSRFPVIIMTGHGDVPLAVEAMKLGAVDFLEKPVDDDLLIAMVDAGLKRAEPEARQEAVTREIAERIATLSPRERQVMDGLVAGLSNKAIAREYDISPRTIEVYRANVMTKMQAGSLSELVRLAMRAGALKD